MRVQALCVALTAALLASNASAQVVAPGYLYVESNRPALSPRALTPDDHKAKQAAIRAWRGARTEANLAAVLPFAQAGDVEAMKTLAAGFAHLAGAPADRGALAQISRPQESITALSGLWAMAAWRQGGPDKALSPLLRQCMRGKWTTIMDRDRAVFGLLQISSKLNDLDCGFDVRARVHQTPRFQAFVSGKNALPVEALVFVERPLVDDVQLAQDRFERELQILKDGVLPNDKAWLENFFAAHPGAKALFEEAAFEGEVIRAAISMPPRDPAFLRAYIAADPSRQRAIDAAHARQQASSAAYAEKQKRDIAIYQGVERTAADIAASRGPSGSSSASSTAMSPADRVNAIREQNNAINRSNCARASMGASISCNR